MWKGLFLNKCMNEDYGYFYDYNDSNTMCTTNDDCSDFSSIGAAYICSKSSFDPNNGVIGFDNFLQSLLAVYITITMEGWTDVFYYLTRTFKSDIYINIIMINLWFISLTLLGGYLLISMFLAVVMSSFSQVEERDTEEGEPKLRSFNELIILKNDIEDFELEKQDKEEEEELKEDEVKGEDNTEEATAVENKEFFSYSIVKDVNDFNKLSPKEIFLLLKKIDEKSAEAKIIKKKLEEEEIIKLEVKIKESQNTKEKEDFEREQLKDMKLPSYVYDQADIESYKRKVLFCFRVLNKEKDDIMSFNINYDDIPNESQSPRKLNLKSLREPTPLSRNYIYQSPEQRRLSIKNFQVKKNAATFDIDNNKANTNKENLENFNEYLTTENLLLEEQNKELDTLEKLDNSPENPNGGVDDLRSDVPTAEWIPNLINRKKNSPMRKKVSKKKANMMDENQSKLRSSVEDLLKNRRIDRHIMLINKFKPEIIKNPKKRRTKSLDKNNLKYQALTSLRGILLSKEKSIYYYLLFFRRCC